MYLQAFPGTSQVRSGMSSGFLYAVVTWGYTPKLTHDTPFSHFERTSPLIPSSSLPTYCIRPINSHKNPLCRGREKPISPHSLPTTLKTPPASIHCCSLKILLLHLHPMDPMSIKTIPIPLGTSSQLVLQTWI